MILKIVTKKLAKSNMKQIKENILAGFCFHIKRRGELNPRS